MRELIRGYAAAVLETAGRNGTLEAVSSDLAGVARALASFDDLRQVLVDGSVPVATRRGVLGDLLEGKTAPETTALLGFVVRAERAAEFSMTVASLIPLAEDAARDARAGVEAQLEPQGARGAVRERIRGYAERVLEELAALNEVDEVEDELFRFARLLDSERDLRRVLTDPNASYAGRVGILTDLLSERAQPATLRLVLYVFRAGRLRDLVGTFEWLVELAAEERGRRVGEVRCAVDLDPSERERLAQALGRLVDRPVEVRTVIDPSVIGGILVSVGDLVIDGTVRFRFERLRDLLAQPS